MAKATAHCTCKKCGAKFEREKICYNRDEADRWEAWATDYFDLCGTCYGEEQKARRESEYAEACEKYSLPTITGVSEKQIRYADSLRRQLFQKFPDLADKYDKLTDILNSDHFLEVCAKHGITDTDAKREEQYSRDRYISVMRVIRTTGEARQIIDATQKLYGYGF